MALRDIGFLDQDRSRDEYRLGLKLFKLGNVVIAGMDLQKEASAFVTALADLTGEEVHLCVFDDRQMVFVDRRAGGMNGDYIVLETTPCHCTGTGKAALAFQEEAVIERVIRMGLKAYTRNTLTERGELLKELAKTRKRGYAIDNCEIEAGRRCVAAPIRSASGSVFASISVSGPERRMTDERLLELAPTVIAYARSISQRLGYHEKEPRDEEGAAKKLPVTRTLKTASAATKVRARG
jgi:DNA-binding IclR family transcriptional regulator